MKTFDPSSMTRRRVLTGMTGLALAGASTAPALAAMRTGPRRLRFYNIHTDERLDVVFKEADGLLPDALEEIDVLLRDFRTGDIHPIDRRLLEAVSVLQAKIGFDRPLTVISGYRSPKTNAKLAAKSSGVAKRSYHMRGMAIDIGRPGIDVRALHRDAKAMRVGGVGLYRASGFVHMDVGPVRYW